MKSIKITHSVYTVDISLNSRITYLCSDSGTGKTMLFELLNSYNIIKGIPELVLISCNSKIGVDEVANLLVACKDKIIFIDNADHVIRNNKVCSIIENDLSNKSSGNYYIISGRDTRLTFLVSDLAKPVITEDRAYIRYLFGE